MRRRLAVVFATWLVSAAWLGCNLILGNESAVFAPEIDAAGLDGLAPSDGGSDAFDFPDGSAPDGDAGPCVDTSKNPRHCGACFHDCLGGQCVDGTCQPFQIAIDESGPLAIAIDETHVYWTNRSTGTLWRVPKSGGSKERLFEAPGEGLGDEIAVHDGRLYFAYTVGDAGVVRCPVTGCSDAGPEPVLENGNPASAVTIEDGVLLFVETASGRIGRCPLPCNGSFDIVASGETLPLRAAQAGNVVAWTVITNEIRIKVGDDAPFGIPTGNNFAVGIAISDGLVYAEEINKGPLVIPTDGGPAVRLMSSNFGYSEELTLDDASVYFTDKISQGRVLRCGRAGCGDSGVELATKQPDPRGIAVDGVSIYWVNSSNTVSGGVGAVMRLAK